MYGPRHTFREVSRADGRREPVRFYPTLFLIGPWKAGLGESLCEFRKLDRDFEGTKDCQRHGDFSDQDPSGMKKARVVRPSRAKKSEGLPFLPTQTTGTGVRKKERSYQ